MTINNWIMKYIFLGLFFITALSIIFSMKKCSNYYICLTNKRIIIRYGIFTNNFSQYSIDNVTGNITTRCIQSIYDSKNGKNSSCIISANIELLPVGHKSISIYTFYSIVNGYEMAKEIEKVVKSNAKITDNTSIKE